MQTDVAAAVKAAQGRSEHGGVMAGALRGIKILEMANYISGPFASMLLADLGAEVTKIEMPGPGDPYRGWGDNAYSPTFCSFNRNKRSLTLNVQTPVGKEIFMRLARDADVVIENMRPGVMDRLGLGYEALRAINPGIVYCSVSGYGSDGPEKDRPGYDTIGQARSGLLSLLTDLDKGVGSPLSDLDDWHVCLLRGSRSTDQQGAWRHRAKGGDFSASGHGGFCRREYRPLHGDGGGSRSGQQAARSAGARFPGRAGPAIRHSPFIAAEVLAQRRQGDRPARTQG